MTAGELARQGLVEAPAEMSAGRWSVAAAGWKRVLPDLPDEVIELLAAPVVVSVDRPVDPPAGRHTRRPAPTRPGAAAVNSTVNSGGADPADSGSSGSGPDVERYPAPTEPCAAGGRAALDCTPRFLAPAPPRIPRGRHRL